MARPEDLVARFNMLLNGEAASFWNVDARMITTYVFSTLKAPRKVSRI